MLDCPAVVNYLFNELGSIEFPYLGELCPAAPSSTSVEMFSPCRQVAHLAFASSFDVAIVGWVAQPTAAFD